MNNFHAVRNKDGSGIVFIEIEGRRFEKHCGDLDNDMDFAIEELLVVIAVEESEDL